ncbi:DUF1553 domain-containing protein [Planctomicrobium sp. SH664]|uniref:DUF1553 domain-containing protein n=1 Tax=Planctomicrobium sp. SH664 TaxID=3448125 RepID=UPI003F5AE687
MHPQTWTVALCRRLILSGSLLCLLGILPAGVSVVPLQAADTLLREDETEVAVRQLTARIDQLLAARWEVENVVPAPLADDAEFFRRVSLDICGRIPEASEVRDFLRESRPGKRSETVQQLLASPAYVIHYTNLWRETMIPEANSDQLVRIVLPGFESWLRSRIAENRNFAQIVEEMLTVPVGRDDVQGFREPEKPTPVAFYRAKEGKPERLAAATSRLFLGVRLDCAECHDHPFDHWKQAQFWENAAFFTDVDLSNAERQSGRIAIPEKGLTVTARFLDGAVPSAEAQDLRAELANWIISPGNPYFARAAVNRIWSYHFGIGLVEPMDDFSEHNPPSHPELLEELAAAFVQQGYDFKFMIRAITASRAYQLTSRQTDPSQSSRRLFARMPVRGLSPEQIFDSLARATGYRQPFNPEQPLNFNNDTARQEFLTTFANQAEAPPDRTSTILQALSLMNGRFISEATDLESSRTLSAVVHAPFLTSDQKIEALYLTTLSRVPTDVERQRLSEFLKQQAADETGRAYADIFWVLLNSNEFLLNH